MPAPQQPLNHANFLLNTLYRRNLSHNFQIEFMRNLLIRMIKSEKASCVAFFLENDDVNLEEIVEPDVFLTALYKVRRSSICSKLTVCLWFMKKTYLCIGVLVDLYFQTALVF